jgi:hypothetical protein
MANQPKARKAPTGDALRSVVYQLTSEMEEPLRHAMQMVRLIGLIEPHEDEDLEAIGYVAHDAATKLHAVSDRLKDLFAACAEG